MRRRWAAVPLSHRVIVAGAAVAAALVALNLLDRVADIDSSLIDLETENSLTTWWSSFQFGLAAIAALAVVLLDGGPATVWAPIAAVMAVFSVDEVAQLHERVEGVSEGHWIVGAVEPLVAVAILAFAVYALRRLTHQQRVLLVLAAVFLVAANASGALNDAGATTASSWGEHLLAAQEEVCEMLVGTFVLAAALPAVVARLRERDAARPTASRSA